MNFELGNNLRTYNILTVLLLLCLAGIATFFFIVPKPDPEIAERAGKLRLEKAQKELNLNLAKQASLKEKNPALWEGQTETITPQILQSISVIAKAQGVNLKSFRPQTPVADGDLSRGNYVLLIDGTFPQVANFVRALDSAANRLGVSQVQISSSDQESDKVNATVAVIAYVKQPVVEKSRESSEKSKETSQKDEKSPNDSPASSSAPGEAKREANE